LPSVHAKAACGRSFIFPGEIRRVRERALRVHEYRDGGALGVIVRARGITVYHNGSADLVDAALEGKRADVLLAGDRGLALRARLRRAARAPPRAQGDRPDSLGRFFGPLEEGVRALPGTAFDDFLEEVRRVAPGVRVVAPTPWEELLVADGGRRIAVVPATGLG